MKEQPIADQIAAIVYRAMLGSGEDFSRTPAEWAEIIMSVFDCDPSPAMIEAAEAAVGEWRKTLSRDEAMMRSYLPKPRPTRKFIASATPAEKHAIRWRAMVKAAITETIPLRPLADTPRAADTNALPDGKED